MRIKETITNLEALTILPDNTIEIAKRTVWRICKQYGDSIDSMENMLTVWRQYRRYEQYGEYVNSMETVWTVWRICKQYGDSIDSMDSMENM